MLWWPSCGSRNVLVGRLGKRQGACQGSRLRYPFFFIARDSSKKRPCFVFGNILDVSDVVLPCGAYVPTTVPTAFARFPYWRLFLAPSTDGVSTVANSFISFCQRRIAVAHVCIRVISRSTRLAFVTPRALPHVQSNSKGNYGAFEPRAHHPIDVRHQGELVILALRNRQQRPARVSLIRWFQAWHVDQCYVFKVAYLTGRWRTFKRLLKILIVCVDEKMRPYPASMIYCLKRK